MNIKPGTKRMIIIFVAAVVLLYFAIYGVPKLQRLLEKTQILEYGELPVSDKTEVLILRTETLYLADVSGNVVYLVTEGEKVRSGVTLININPAPPPTSGTGDAENSTGEPQETIYHAIAIIAGDSAVSSPGNAAQFSGVFSTYLDGYEQIFNAASIDEISLEDAENVTAAQMDLKREYVYKGEPVYKITDNTIWHMVYWVEEDTAQEDQYEVGASVQVIIDGFSLEAVIESKKKVNGYYKIVLKSDVFYKDLSKIRKAEAEIRYGEYEGLIVDEECVVERDGQKGVFVKQRNGEFEWTPVSAKMKSNGKYVVEAVMYYDEKGNPVDTVIYYDEVLRNPKK